MKRKNFIIVVVILTLICMFLYVKIFKQNNKYQKDMEYFIDVVENNYPYEEYLKLDTIKDKYILEANNCKSTEEFYEHLDSMVDQYEGLGHLYILNAEEYYLHLATYDMALKNNQISEKNSNYKILKNDKVRYVYDELSKLTGITLEMVEENMEENQQGINNDNVHFQQYDDVLIIKIDSFNYSLIESDIKRIKEYLASYNGNCIAFDIRENGGGADLYWINLIAMTTNQDYEYSSKITGRGDMSLSYVKEEFTNETINKSGSDFEIQTTDKIKSKNIYDFEKIYILTSDKNFSSADSFVKFAKENQYAISVGQNTKGSGGDRLNPMLVELPNTHIVFRMDACRSDNIETKPDIVATGDTLQFFLNMKK